MEALTTSKAPVKTRDQCEISSAERISPLIQSAELEFQATVRLLAERARFLTAASGAAVALEEQGKQVYYAVSGDSVPPAGTTVDTNKEPIGQCIAQTKAVRSRTVGGTALFALAAPIITDEKVIGLFELRGPSTFEDRDLESIVRLAEMVGTAIDHRRAAEQVDRKLFAPFAEIAHAAILPSHWHAPETAKSETPQPEPAPGPGVLTASVQKCASCGFPISQGRTLCVECDQKLGHAAPPTELFSTPEEESWISVHVYSIASVLITALAVAIIFWLR
jgi:hypothetical protein